ncbi:MAG: aminotransferase class I/II-fold pyridoxal phosphate-dependent enzyme [Candidatus Nanohaloarchaeota archaeon QJJ-7]|nr:aminotransferase class I/II-fold pyridoxal phosphate-dependent enzyme [Candidatus Nanohaloarchaeota archaeon QJJ-7]
MVRREIEELETDEYAEKGKAELDMSLNVNPLGPPETSVQAVRNLPEEKICHYQHPGDDLRGSVADLIDIPQDALILTNGCDGALEKLALTYFDKNIDVAIPVPSFHRYETHARKMGSSITFIESEGSDFHPSIEEMADCGSDYLVLANPQNPSGERFSNKEIETLVQEFNGTIILDEALEHPYRTHAPLTMDEDIIVVGSFSKILGLAGLRAGYIAGGDKKQIRKSGSPFQINAAAQEAVRAAVESEDYLERTDKTVSDELSYIKGRLERIGISYSESESLPLLISLKDTRFEKKSSDLVSLMKKEGVKIVDGGHFRGLEKDHIRISVRDRSKNKAFITSLEKVLEQEEY